MRTDVGEHTVRLQLRAQRLDQPLGLGPYRGAIAHRMQRDGEAMQRVEQAIDAGHEQARKAPVAIHQAAFAVTDHDLLGPEHGMSPWVGSGDPIRAHAHASSPGSEPGRSHCRRNAAQAGKRRKRPRQRGGGARWAGAAAAPHMTNTANRTARRTAGKAAPGRRPGDSAAVWWPRTFVRLHQARAFPGVGTCVPWCMT